MRYIKKVDGRVQSASKIFVSGDKTIIGFNKNPALMVENGYIPYEGTNSNSYVDIANNTITELPVPEVESTVSLDDFTPEELERLRGLIQ